MLGMLGRICCLLKIRRRITRRGMFSAGLRILLGDRSSSSSRRLWVSRLKTLSLKPQADLMAWWQLACFRQRSCHQYSLGANHCAR
ncbi:hypothetical protein BJX70DRAFT_354096 [Aspergillus crustosus]